MSVIFRTALFLLACCFMVPLDAAAWDRGRVERFASLPEGAPHPEGITADHNGDVYVPGFASRDQARRCSALRSTRPTGFPTAVDSFSSSTSRQATCSASIR